MDGEKNYTFLKCNVVFNVVMEIIQVKLNMNTQPAKNWRKKVMMEVWKKESG